MAKKDKKKKINEAEESVEEVSEEAVDEVLEESGPIEPEEEISEELEELTAEEILELKQLLETNQREAAENLDGWQRSKAELINYRKRIEREKAKIYEDSAARVIRRYLDVMDDLDLALAERPQDGNGVEWAEGIELIYRKLLTILENEGVKPLEAEGHIFDPKIHEAVSQEESPDHESGQIIEVIKKGYLIGERVLRPAKVRVAS